jgi:hypothetical protein
MVKGIAESPGRIAGANRSDHQDPQESSFDALGSQPNGKVTDTSETALPLNEEGLLREAIQSLREIRYGSVVLIMHDGHLVEVTKTVRIRSGRGRGSDR